VLFRHGLNYSLLEYRTCVNFESGFVVTQLDFSKPPPTAIVPIARRWYSSNAFSIEQLKNQPFVGAPDSVVPGYNQSSLNAAVGLANSDPDSFPSMRQRASPKALPSPPTKTQVRCTRILFRT
jgi:hypothetical protein